MGLREVKKELDVLDKKQIIELVVDLYKKNKSVREYLDFFALPNEKELFEKYKVRVYEAFHPKRGFGYKLKAGKQAIADFKKLGTSPDLLAELMLFYVETGVEFTQKYGDMDLAYYNSLESTFFAALNGLEKSDLLEQFRDRAQGICESACNIGWGLYDSLQTAFDRYY
ncbi:MAG: hypothetical protein H6581_18880 [Bacteroidia bacterium]|nr:hypothetical protein [Bacteroidia bacterium]